MRYRFGFNGKENNNEVKGTGNQLDFGARIYDPRIGRFLSVDKLSKMDPDGSVHFVTLIRKQVNGIWKSVFLLE